MAHRSRLGCITIDCREDDFADAAAFWGAAFGGVARVDDDGSYAHVCVDGGEPRVLLQRVEHDPRVHLDVETDDQDAQASRLQALGAKRIGRVRDWIVMEAPTGHRFCRVGPQRADFDAVSPRFGTSA